MADQPSTPGSKARQARPDNDIYTLMTAIAVFALLGTLAFVIYRTNELLGKPFAAF